MTKTSTKPFANTTDRDSAITLTITDARRIRRATAAGALALGLIGCQPPMMEAEPGVEELRQELPQEPDVSLVLAALEERGCGVDIDDSAVVRDDSVVHLPFIAGPTVCEDTDMVSYLVVLVAPDRTIRFAGGLVTTLHDEQVDGVVATAGEVTWTALEEWGRQSTSAAYGPYAARTAQSDPTVLSSDRLDPPVVSPYGACGDCVATCKDTWQNTESACESTGLVDFLLGEPVKCLKHALFGGSGTTEECFDSCGACPSDDRCEDDGDCNGWFSGCPSDDPDSDCITCEFHSYDGGASIGVCADTSGDPS